MRSCDRRTQLYFTFQNMCFTIHLQQGFTIKIYNKAYKHVSQQCFTDRVVNNVYKQALQASFTTCFYIWAIRTSYRTQIVTANCHSQLSQPNSTAKQHSQIAQPNSTAKQLSLLGTPHKLFQPIITAIQLNQPSLQRHFTKPVYYPISHTRSATHTQIICLTHAQLHTPS